MFPIFETSATALCGIYWYTVSWTCTAASLNFWKHVVYQRNLVYLFLLPLLSSSFLWGFAAPKQFRFQTQTMGGTIHKFEAQLPNLWPRFWAPGLIRSGCQPVGQARVQLRQVSSLINQCFRKMFSCAWLPDAGFTMGGRHKEGSIGFPIDYKSSMWFHLFWGPRLTDR